MSSAKKVAKGWRGAFEVRDGDVQETSWSYIKGVIAEAIEADRKQRDQSAQQARDALKSLPEGEAAQVALDTLRGHGYIVKAWSRDDLEATLDQWDEELTPDQRERVLDAAQDSGYFRDLADCTDSDWDTVGFALSDALSEVRAEGEGDAA